MPYLNLDLDYFTHPKTMRLIGLLGRAAEVLPIRLWAYCGKHFAEDGRLTDHSPQEIESLTGWWGKEGAAVEAMLKVGFMKKVKNGYQVHDWKDYQGHIGALKERNRKVAINRWKNIRDSKVTVYTSGIPYGIQESNPGVPFLSVPSLPSKPNFPNHPSKPKTKERAAKFTPPSPLEAANYARSIGFSLDGEQFCAFYQAKGWVVGRSPMRDWTASIRTWKIRHAGEKGGTYGGKNSGGIGRRPDGAAPPEAGSKFDGIGKTIEV
jgi:hypothetical protein